MPDTTYDIRVAWDAEAGVCYIADSDVPGLVCEGETVDALLDHARHLTPELLELNHVSGAPLPAEIVLRVHFELRFERHLRVPIAN